MAILDLFRGKSFRLTDGKVWQAIFGGEGHAGKPVTMQTMLELPTAWACIRLIAAAIATMPIGVYRRETDGSRTSIDHQLLDVLAGSPNIDQTPAEFWEGAGAWIATQGNGYAEIVRSGSRVSALLPISSMACEPYRDHYTDELVYRVRDRGKLETLPRDKILHLKGFGFGGDIGLSPVRFGVQTFSSAIAAEEVAGRMFGRGLHVSGVVTTAGTLTDKQREQNQAIMEKFAGSSNTGKLMVLEAGQEFRQLQMSAADAELLESRRFSIEEICRWFGVPPILVGHAGQGQTMFGSGVEQILIAWLTLGLNPYLKRIEQRIAKQLLAPGEQRRVYVEFNREGLLQADTTAKADFLVKMVSNALMTRNEGRAKLNLPRQDGGDALTAQSNLAPIELLGNLSSDQAGRNALLAFLGLDKPQDEPKGDKHAIH